MNTGTIGIPKVGAIDMTLSFDKNNPIELERTKRIITDMLRQGYAILIQVGKKEAGRLLDAVELNVFPVPA